METFGLFQLLNTLLPKTSPKEDEKEAAPPTDPPKIPQSPPALEKGNACVDFFERHTKQAKKRK